MARRSMSEYLDVRAMLADGATIAETTRALGVPRDTVRRWRDREDPPSPATRAELGRTWAAIDAERYAYLLGAYLGDGTVSCTGRGWTLRIVNDRRYPCVSAEILRAMGVVFPGATPRLWPAWVGEADVLHIAHPALPRAFPQHGPGRKHTRPIELTDWQREITHAHPGALVRGLIHSDGCRCVNQVTTTLPSGRVAHYEYVRYFFTNHSADIRRIFVEHCELLGISVTQSNHRNLSVARRAGVAILEEVVGPKG